MMRDIVSMEYNSSFALYTHNFLDTRSLYDCSNYPSNFLDWSACTCLYGIVGTHVWNPTHVAGTWLRCEDQKVVSLKFNILFYV